MDITYQTINERLTKIEVALLCLKTVFTFDELVAYTGLSKSHLYKLTSSGRIPCSKPFGKHLYFNKLEIDEWLLQNRKATTSELQARANEYSLGKKGGVR